jgi:hypothetical protein
MMGISTNAFNIVTVDISQILKSPLIPLFKGGDHFIPLFGKEGPGEI